MSSDPYLCGAGHNCSSKGNSGVAGEIGDYAGGPVLSSGKVPPGGGAVAVAPQVPDAVV